MIKNGLGLYTPIESTTIKWNQSGFITLWLLSTWKRTPTNHEFDSSTVLDRDPPVSKQPQDSILILFSNMDFT